MIKEAKRDSTQIIIYVDEKQYLHRYTKNRNYFRAMTMY